MFRSELIHSHYLATNLLGQALLRPCSRLKPNSPRIPNRVEKLKARPVWGLVIANSIYKEKYEPLGKINNILSLSAPARTLTYVVDPGPTRIGSTSILGQYGRGWLDLQVSHQVSTETRPSGRALELRICG